MGRQTVGSVHFRRHSRALQPFLVQVRRVLCPADVAVPGRSQSRGPAGGRLRRRRHGSVWRRELPLILHRYEAAKAVHDSLISSVKETMSRPPDAIPLLVGVIHAADARSKENVNATENCISAVGKVMRFQPECVNLNLVLPHWLSWLPLNEDKEEAVHTFDFLCDLIER